MDLEEEEVPTHSYHLLASGYHQDIDNHRSAVFGYRQGIVRVRVAVVVVGVEVEVVVVAVEVSVHSHRSHLVLDPQDMPLDHLRPLHNHHLLSPIPQDMSSPLK